MTEIVLLPVAYTEGIDFKRAPSPRPVDHVLRPVRYDRRRGPSDELRFDDGPGAVAEIDIAATPATVWALISDINLPAQFSEFIGADWASDERGVGAVFEGRNHHPAIGEWTIPCFVDTCDEPRSFGWRTSDVDPGAAGASTSNREAHPPAVRLLHGAWPFGYDDGDRDPSKETPRAAPPHRRGLRQHATDRRRRKAARRDLDMTLRVGIGAVPLQPGATSSSARPNDSVSTRCGARSSGRRRLHPLAYLAARTSTIKLGTGIAQLGARTPAMLAMTAQSVHALSGGRCLLGIGTSGPQVMEGWHGVAFDKPVRRTARPSRSSAPSPPAPASTTTARSTTSAPRQRRPCHPLADAAGAPAHLRRVPRPSLRLTGELADGWIGTAFLPETAEVFLDPIRDGAASAGRSLADLDLTVAVGVEFTDDVETPAPCTPRATRFTASAPWARPVPTSTTTPSNAKASATTSARSNASGSPATRTPPGDGSQRHRARHQPRRHRRPRATDSASTATPASPHCASTAAPTSTSTTSSATSNGCSTRATGQRRGGHQP